MRPLLTVALALGFGCAADEPALTAAPDTADAASSDGSPDVLAGDTSAPDVPVETDIEGPDDAVDPTAAIPFGKAGPIAGDSGKGSFTFGVATAATQIEDQNPNTDWYLWTDPAGLAKSPFVGEAVHGYSKALEDVALLKELGVDRYRFSVEWARVEPKRNQIDEAALAHYDALVDALVEAGIRPMITVHHFGSPVWFDDPRDLECANGPSDTNLCGWDHETGGPVAVAELAEFAGLLAERYGDRVDEWATLNEPVNYLFSAYGVGMWPPGKQLAFADFPALVRVIQTYAAAHVAIYDAIHAKDTIDADKDGSAADIGFTLSTMSFQPTRENKVSTHPDDVAAAERIDYVYHTLFARAFTEGGFDTDLDGVIDAPEPTWKGKLDWLGVQYYARIGVTAEPAVIPVVNLMICFGTFDFGACAPPEEPTHWIPDMGYEFWEPGLREALGRMTERFPGMPLTVTEGGIATRNGNRRSENIVRSLEQIALSIQDGADVRGYTHWSLIDNFEWQEGYEPKFGLYTVDLDTYARTATQGVETFARVIQSRSVSAEQRATHGGTGPMTPEPAPP